MAWAPDYAEVDDLAAYTRIPDDADDVQLGLAIATASRGIDDHCRRQFGLVAAPEARHYPVRWDARRGQYVADIDDLMTTTGLELDGEAVADPLLLPRNAAAKGGPWTTLVLSDAPAREVEITARWGWAEVPDAIVQACLLQASRLFSRRNSPYGVAGSPDTGSELRLLAKVDPDVAVALRPYRKLVAPR